MLADISYLHTITLLTFFRLTLYHTVRSRITFILPS